MTAKLFYKLIGSGYPDTEVGPFDSAAQGPDTFAVNGGSTAMSFGAGVWTVLDGAALGDAHLTGHTYEGIILGQAKLI